MKKRKLEVDFEYDFILFGLISTLREYKLAWYINQYLDISMRKVDDIVISFLKGQNLVISNYLYATEHSKLRLLRNKSMDELKSTTAYLLPELNQFDYLVIFKGFEGSYDEVELKNKLTSIPKVNFVKVFDPSGLKSKENLIF